MPQLLAAVALHIPCGSAALSTAEQVPTLPLRLQALHAPVQAALQHTPCAQKPELQSDLSVHSTPFGKRPHLLPRQEFGSEHIESEVQVVPHF